MQRTAPTKLIADGPTSVSTNCLGAVFFVARESVYATQERACGLAGATEPQNAVRESGMRTGQRLRAHRDSARYSMTASTRNLTCNAPSSSNV